MKIKIPTIKPRNPHYKDLLVLKSKKIPQKKGFGSYNRKKKETIDE